MAADETAVVNRPKRVRTGNLPHLIHPNVSFFFFFFFWPLVEDCCPTGYFEQRTNRPLFYVQDGMICNLKSY